MWNFDKFRGNLQIPRKIVNSVENTLKSAIFSAIPEGLLYRPTEIASLAYIGLHIIL